MTQILYQSQLEDRLKEFRLSGIAKTVAARMKQAEAGNLSYAEFMAFLLEDEANARADNRRFKLFKSARLPFEKDLSDFDFTFASVVVPLPERGYGRSSRESLELSYCWLSIVRLWLEGLKPSQLPIGPWLPGLVEAKDLGGRTGSMRGCWE